MPDADKALHPGGIGEKGVPDQAAMGADLEFSAVKGGKPAVSLPAMLQVKRAQIQIAYDILLISR
jgi:hypothetical protein